MKFADIEGNVERHSRALPGNAAIAVMRCSPDAVLSIWHWAHPKSKVCDRWWEHGDGMASVVEEPISRRVARDWTYWQSGERHRADVKTESGLVLEFQHSPLSEAERVSREDVYPRLVWVVHANRRRDQKKFFASFPGRYVSHRDCRPLPSSEMTALSARLGESRAPVYFDFDETERVWRLYPFSGEVLAYVTPVDRAGFVKSHRDGDNLEELFDQVFARDRKIASAQAIPRLPLPDFSRYSTRRMRRL